MGLKQFDWFPATFQPERRDGLKPAAEEWIGWTGLWEAAFVIEEGDYEGQFACVVKVRSDGTYGGPHPPTQAFTWVPESDLVPVHLSKEDLASIEERAIEILEARGSSGVNEVG